jgi:predicted MFS family arabinose efflux permease
MQGGADLYARRLDALNFFLADVRDGLGPYLAIYLLTIQKWDEALIGVVLSVAAMAGIVAQTPAGAIVDGSRAKRGLIVVAAVVVTVGSLMLPLFPGFAFVAGMQALTGTAGALFPPAIAALTLGMVGPAAFARRVGRNEAYNHAGNATAAGIAAVSAYWFGPVVVFWVMSAMAVASIAIALSIPADAIDDHVARGLAAGAEHAADQPSG